MPDEPLHPSERDLADLAAVIRQDAYLQQMASEAEDGVGAPIGLLANGMVVYGRLGPERLMAEEVDAYLEWVIQGGETAGADPEGWKEARERLGGMAVRMADKRKEARQEVLNRAEEFSGEEGFDWPAAPRDLAREVIRERVRPALTLREARILVPGQSQPLEVPVMRVNMTEVSGWWLLRDRGDDTSTSVSPTPA